MRHAPDPVEELVPFLPHQVSGSGREATVTAILQKVDVGLILDGARSRLAGQSQPLFRAFYDIPTGGKPGLTAASTVLCLLGQVRAFILFLCVVAGVVFAAGAFAEFPAASLDQVSHDDGSSCPDSDHGGPCSPVCPCTCCPGHAMAASPGVRPSAVLTLVEPVQEVEVSSPEDLHPKDLRARIFHPPRA